MANQIKLGNLDISAFKVGNADCKVYLGDTLLYPTTPPTMPNYFRFVAREDGQFKLSGNSISYSLDSGTTWTSLASDTYSPTVSSGSCIMFKGTNLSIVTNNGIGMFYSTGAFDVEGNIMSLIHGDDFKTAKTITNTEQFRSLFDSNTNVINTSGLTLPATAISQDAYRSMFYSCSNLVTSPTILLATTLGESCYKYMFRNCTSLTTAPQLPSTSLTQSCYSYMFQGCTSLTTAPALPATIMQRQCYEYMFSGCTSLTTAPDLPAATLAYQSNRYMFAKCSNLNYIKCLATNISATNCTTGWVDGVSSRGTFVKASSMSDWTRTLRGIPISWTVEDYIPKWKATYQDTSVIYGNCDATSAITDGEITLTDLVSVETGPCLTSIGNSAFFNCGSLTSCTIGSGVTSIGVGGFRNCSSLTSLTVEATTPPTLSNVNAFDNTNNCPIYVPASSLSAYQSAWSSYASRIQAIPT